MTDDGVVPIAPGDHNFTEAAAGELRPRRSQPCCRSRTAPTSLSRDTSDLGPVAIPCARRRPCGNGHLGCAMAGPEPGRRARSCPRVTSRDVRALHGRRLWVVLARVPRHGRVRAPASWRRPQGWRRLPHHRRVPAGDVRDGFRRADDHGQRALRLRAQRWRSDLAPPRRYQPDVRGPRERRARRPDGLDRSATTTTSWDWVFTDAAEIEVRLGATGPRRGQRCRDTPDGDGQPRPPPTRVTARWSRRISSRCITITTSISVSISMWTGPRTSSTTTPTGRRRCPTARRGAASTSSSPGSSRRRNPRASIPATGPRSSVSSMKPGRNAVGNPVSYKSWRLQPREAHDQCRRLARPGARGSCDTTSGPPR